MARVSAVVLVTSASAANWPRESQFGLNYGNEGLAGIDSGAILEAPGYYQEPSSYHGGYQEPSFNNAAFNPAEPEDSEDVLAGAWALGGEESNLYDLNNTGEEGQLLYPGGHGAQGGYAGGAQGGLKKCTGHGDQGVECNIGDSCTKRSEDADSGKMEGVCRKCALTLVRDSKVFARWSKNKSIWKKTRCYYGANGVDGFAVTVGAEYLNMGRKVEPLRKDMQKMQKKVYNMHSADGNAIGEAFSVENDDQAVAMSDRLNNVPGTLQELGRFQYPGSHGHYVVFEKFVKRGKPIPYLLDSEGLGSGKGRFNRCIHQGLILLHDVVTALKGMHSRGVTHGDIRLETIGTSKRRSGSDNVYFRLGDYGPLFRDTSAQAERGYNVNVKRIDVDKWEIPDGCQPMWRFNDRQAKVVGNPHLYEPADDVECAFEMIRVFALGPDYQPGMAMVGGENMPSITGFARLTAIQKKDAVTWCEHIPPPHTDDKNNHVRAWQHACKGVMSALYTEGNVNQPKNILTPLDFDTILEAIDEAYTISNGEYGSRYPYPDNLKALTWANKQSILAHQH